MFRKKIAIISLLLLSVLCHNSILYAEDNNLSNLAPLTSKVNKQGYDVIPIKYTDARVLVDNINRYIDYSAQEGTISVDQQTNSVILKGTEKFNNSIKSVLKKIDVQKQFKSFSLSEEKREKAFETLKSHFQETQAIENTGVIKDSALLSNSSEKNPSGALTIKCSIEKSDSLERLAEPPTIKLSSNDSVITILGNQYQIETAKSIVESFKNRNSIKVSESSNLKKQLQEVRSKLDTSLIQIKEKDNLLATSEKNIDSLNSQLKKLQSERLWGMLTPQKTDLAELKDENEKNKQEIASMKTIIDYKSKLIEEKDKELASALDKIKELQSYKTETTLKDNSNNSNLLVSTLSELSDLKTQLKKTKQQLNTSKYQIELIFGGKLLDSIVMPNDKSGWFK